MNRTALLYGALLGALAVAFGAFGAHALSSRLEPGLLADFETGARYQMYHALALLALGAAGLGRPLRRGWPGSSALLLVGTLVFSGSLYLLAFSGARLWGAVTPVGGVLQIAGWALVALEAVRRKGAEELRG